MPKSPHVLILPGWYPNTFHPFSGDFVKYQAKLLQGKGLSLSIISLDLDYRFLQAKPKSLLWKTEHFLDEFGVNTFTKKGFFLPKISFYLLNKWALHFLNLYEKYVSVNQKPDIIHAHNYLGGLGASHIKKKYNIPYIITEHSTAFLEDSIPSHHKKAVYKAYENAENIIGVSPALSNRLEEWTSTPVLTIPNFIDTKLFSPKTIDNNIFRFLFAGDLIKRKNASLLIDAFAKLVELNPSGFELTLVGSGPLKSELEARVHQKNITSQVRFLGQRTQEELVSDIQESQVLVLPSIHETFGLVLVEAMACGIPVISSKSGGPNTIVNKNNGILLEDLSITCLFQAMENMIDNYQSYSKDNIRSEALEHYSVDAIYAKLLSIYKDI